MIPPTTTLASGPVATPTSTPASSSQENTNNDNETKSENTETIALNHTEKPVKVDKLQRTLKYTNGGR